MRANDSMFSEWRMLCDIYMLCVREIGSADTVNHRIDFDRPRSRLSTEHETREPALPCPRQCQHSAVNHRRHRTLPVLASLAVRHLPGGDDADR